MFKRVNKAAEKPARERAAERERDGLRQQIKRSLPLHRERFLRELLLGSTGRADAETLRRRASLFEVELPVDGSYRVVLLQTSGGTDGEADVPDCIRVMHRMEERLTESAQLPGLFIRPVPVSDDQVAVIVGCGRDIVQGDREALEAALEAVERTNDPPGLPVSVGVSSPGVLADLPKLYAQAARALEAGRYSDRTPRFVFHDDIGEDERDVPSDAADVDALTRRIRELLFAETAPDVRTLFGRYGEGSGPLENREAKRLLLLLSNALQTLYAEAGVSLNGLTLLFLSLWNKLDAEAGPTDVRPAIERMASLARTQLLDERRPLDGQAVKDIKRIVMNRYTEPITLREIADGVSLSLSHANGIFQNKTGRKLFDYLTDYRMEKAKSLLRETGCDMEGIARQVGYASRSQFRLLFHACTGLDPSEYRDRL
ncbi:helix-turn-helix domain-containing protein [Paenibacillus flagellatus]|uniref:HTH araC/xylS-type domain-containing protein n=1 Tax=Paenibacillus flagellatus TaxID=2211139 RepID=A0A2V5KHF8_9BACL|nr:helix-turn-helix domain-containing protein [Paenibacillus flagellatus]PYI53750.1 hypothetical protein DLM86_14370 [Paenibacillus flagellatus]